MQLSPDRGRPPSADASTSRDVFLHLIVVTDLVAWIALLISALSVLFTWMNMQDRRQSEKTIHVARVSVNSVAHLVGDITVRNDGPSAITIGGIAFAYGPQWVLNAQRPVYWEFDYVPAPLPRRLLPPGEEITVEAPAPSAQISAFLVPWSLWSTRTGASGSARSGAGANSASPTMAGLLRDDTYGLTTALGCPGSMRVCSSGHRGRCCAAPVECLGRSASSRPRGDTGSGLSVTTSIGSPGMLPVPGTTPTCFLPFLVSLTASLMRRVPLRQMTTRTATIPDLTTGAYGQTFSSRLPIPPS